MVMTLSTVSQALNGAGGYCRLRLVSAFHQRDKWRRTVIRLGSVVVDRDQCATINAASSVMHILWHPSPSLHRRSLIVTTLMRYTQELQQLMSSTSSRK